ncbi:phosphate ABC transporter substrate-binding protein [Litoribrevibacter albus]|uniref:ABC transporter substrate-binding protein n=1 Tax=Litoribrevibacter albus TaxID=1473156 RepID=A0AA37SBU2_9GAMM|nr:phosphate ABC transporter substrate-binding protein [Litoribrevibacter albus]GLQ32424.1 ABC transporter substrate-binding protein [Litoribrevibacter albus]
MKYVFVVLFSLLSSMAMAGTSVIINAADAGAGLSQGDAKNVYLGKKKSLPSGAKAIPVDQAAESAIREGFLSTIVGKSESQYKSFWAKKVFTGKGKPPEEKADDAAVKAFVASTPGAVGYIDSSNLDDTVKEAFSF